MSASQVPASLVESIREFHEELRLNRVTELLHFQGSHHLFDRTDIEQFLANFDVRQKGITYRLAQQEVKSDFRHYRRIMLVHLWSSIEHLVYRTIVRLADNGHYPVTQEHAGKEIEKVLRRSQEEEERIKWIGSVLAANHEAFDRFERMLLSLGLPNSGGPPDTIEKDMQVLLNELRQIRNCIVHRRGKIDAKLLYLAPSLKGKCTVNALIPIDRLQSIYYEVSVLQYSYSIYSRVYKLYGANERDLQAHINS